MTNKNENKRIVLIPQNFPPNNNIKLHKVACVVVVDIPPFVHEVNIREKPISLSAY